MKCLDQNKILNIIVMMWINYFQRDTKINQKNINIKHLSLDISRNIGLQYHILKLCVLIW
jgi:hypothetical protein